MHAIKFYKPHFKSWIIWECHGFIALKLPPSFFLSFFLTLYMLSPLADFAVSYRNICSLCFQLYFPFHLKSLELIKPNTNHEERREKGRERVIHECSLAVLRASMRNVFAGNFIIIVAWGNIDFFPFLLSLAFHIALILYCILVFSS